MIAQLQSDVHTRLTHLETNATINARLSPTTREVLVNGVANFLLGLGYSMGVYWSSE